jgi:protein-disulfide isomerase
MTSLILFLLQDDMEDPVFAETLERNLALARELSLQGTPAFVVGERLIQGAMSREQLAALISREREASGP